MRLEYGHFLVLAHDNEVHSSFRVSFFAVEESDRYHHASQYCIQVFGGDQRGAANP